MGPTKLIPLILAFLLYPKIADANIGINVSPQGTTTQISTYGTNVASNANDENSNTIAITGKAYLPWWNVELPYDVLIKKIIVYNRNVAPERLSNSDVEIRDGTTLVTTSSIGDASSTYTFEFDYGDGVIGNSVKVQKVGSPTTTWLQLAEVEVYGFPLTPSSSPSETTIGGGTSAPVTEPSSDPSTIPSLLPSVFIPGHNWAVYGTASQIGNYSNAYGVAEASRAIDGDNTNGLFGDISSVAVTNKVAVPWWKVEFPYSIIIEKIVVYNRRSGDGCNTDCTARLSNSEVRIMDGETVVDVKSIGDTTNVVSFPFEYGMGGVTGNTVMIQKVGEPFITWLQLAEVEVYGVPLMPSSFPSQSPSNNPSVIASSVPSKSPVPTIFMPTSRPSAEPSGLPYATPSDMPSTEIQEPSSDPSVMPTSVPFTSPSSLPSLVPFADPSSVPFSSPSSVPTSVPFADPSLDPSGVPSFVPSIVPSVLPSILPSVDVPGENWALMGSASQVGDYEDALGFAIASRAIDGNRDNDHFQTQSVSITSRTTNPWWRLDLPFHIIITKIVVFNRGEGSGTGSECDKACTGRLSNSEVRIINDGAVMNTTTIVDAQGVVAFSFDYGEGVEGNSVMIQQVAEPGATWIQLAEVEVYGIVLSPTSAPSTSPTVSSFPSVYTPGENWAPSGNASQISDYEDQLGAAVASRAIDGNRANEHFILQSVAITDRVSLPWWKVDLPFHILITKIVVYNRGIEQTCDVLCTGRLSNSEVRIMDNGVIMDVQNITNTTNVIALPFDYTVYGEGVIGNSVMIQKVGPPTFTWLQLAEVEIYGIPLTPSSSPSSIPTGIPSSTPSISRSISFVPSESFKPTTLLEKPSDVPSVKPSSEPFALPSEEPSGVPYADPSSEPSGVPYTSPSSEPSVLPSSLPSIFRPSENWAPLGNASQISDYADMTGTAIASRAIDRNTANDHFITHSVSITSKTALPWWKVDLPFHILIQKIVVYNRGIEQTCDELCTGRLSNSEVRIMDEGAIVNVTDIGDSTNVIAFLFEYGEGVIGNSVMIQKVGAPSITWLGLAEVEIYGLPSSVPSSTPSSTPSSVLSLSPSISNMPSILPSSVPSISPTMKPSPTPTMLPTLHPSTSTNPSTSPTISLLPSVSPTSVPSKSLSNLPSISLEPTTIPSSLPSRLPTKTPSSAPSFTPTSPPTDTPSTLPTTSISPSQYPSNVPSFSSAPTKEPIFAPIDSPNSVPSVSLTPTSKPSTIPSPATSETPVPPSECTFFYNESNTADPLQFDINLTEQLYIQKPAISPGFFSMFTQYSLDDRYYTVRIYKKDCKTVPFPDCPIITYNSTNDISSPKINKINLEFRYNQTLIQESDLWTLNNTGGEVDFCVRVTNYLDPSFTFKTHFSAVKYHIDVDFLTDFDGSVDIERADVFEGFDFIDYEEDIRVYQCDSSFNMISPPRAVSQGEYVQICVDTVEGSQFEVRSIKELVATQNGGQSYSFVSEFQDSPLTSTTCIASGTSEAKCSAKFMLITSFFDENDPDDLNIVGEVKIDYIGRRRRVSKDVPVRSRFIQTFAGSEIPERYLNSEDTDKSLGVFEFSVALVSSEDDEFIDTSGSTPSFAYTYVESIVFTMFVALLGWWTLG